MNKQLLVRNYNLIDIKEYEAVNCVNILDIFNSMSVNGLIDLIKLGNGKCNDKEACDKLDEYLENEENSLITAFIEIKNKLLGTSDEVNNKDTDGTFDITEYDSLTDIYIHFNMQLMSVGLAYSDFWNMNTTEMYKVFNSIMIKMQNEENRQLSNYHTLAAMVGGAVWGKLQKDPPQVKMTDSNNAEEDSEELILAAKLKSFANSYNKQHESNKE